MADFADPALGFLVVLCPVPYTLALMRCWLFCVALRYSGQVRLPGFRHSLVLMHAVIRWVSSTERSELVTTDSQRPGDAGPAATVSV